MTGGLGPTTDDITREVTAELLGLELRQDPTSPQRSRIDCATRGFPMTDRILRQAEVPTGAVVLPNENGTAPGSISAARTRDGRQRRICFCCPARRASCSRCSRFGPADSSEDCSRRPFESNAGRSELPAWENRWSRKRSVRSFSRSRDLSSVTARAPVKWICASSDRGRLLDEAERIVSDRLSPLSIFSTDDENLKMWSCGC